MWVGRGGRRAVAGEQALSFVPAREDHDCIATVRKLCGQAREELAMVENSTPLGVRPVFSSSAA